MKKRKAHQIYESRLHLFFTFLVVVVPFLFLLFFSRLAHITLGKLFSAVGVSLLRLMAAYFFAAVIGWVLAVSFYRGKRAAVVLPILDVLQSLPLFAALPLAAFYWGQTNFTVIFFLVLAIIWPIIFSITSSLKLSRRDWEEVVEVYRLRGFYYLKEFLWPISIPGLITGSVIGLGEGWESIVATEIILGIKTGVGNFFQFFSHNPTVSAFGIIGFLIIIFSINKLIWLPLLDWSHQRMEE